MAHGPQHLTGDAPEPLTLVPVSVPFLALGIWLLTSVALRLADPIARQVAGGIKFGSPLLSLAMMGAACICVCLAFCWNFMKTWRGYGPFHFDRDVDQLRFGPVLNQQSRPLSTITALQLIPATYVTVLDKDAVYDLEKKWLGRFVRSLLTRMPKKIHQVNLVFDDGSRLNVTNWGGWTGKVPASMQVAAEELAKFLNEGALQDSLGQSEAAEPRSAAPGFRSAPRNAAPGSASPFCS